MEKNLTSLAMGVATQITNDYIEDLIKEAQSWPDGSREKRALMNYAKVLGERLDKQKELDSK